MSSGMPIVFRAAMKPTPSIYLEQDSVDMVTMKPVKLSIKGRHDPCVVVRALPVFEAAAAIAITDLLLDN
jgi:chorismate synthase